MSHGGGVPPKDGRRPTATLHLTILELARAAREKAQQQADQIVKAEIDKERVRIDAEAKAAQTKILQEGQAAAYIIQKDAEAEGIRINWLRTISSMGEGDLTVEVQELDDNGKPHGTGRFETLAADTVILALGQESDTGFLRRVRNIRARGAAAKLNLALEGLPESAGLALRHLSGRIVIPSSVAQLERAADAVKYRRHSERPAIEAVVPTLHDPSLAPDGKHVLSAVVQYAPPEIEGGWTEAARLRAPEGNAAVTDAVAWRREEVLAALANDLDTPGAVQKLDSIAGVALGRHDDETRRSAATHLHDLATRLLGLRLETAQ